MSHTTASVTGRGLGRYSILALGFRPFYLLAGLFAVVALPLWIAIYSGWVVPSGYLHGVAWHSHEMLFGFATAVMAGFLLTAVRNWTDRPTPTGAWLAALAMLWVLARVLVWTGPRVLAMLVDAAFLPALAAVIAAPIWRSKNVRNFKLLAVLAVFSIANVLYHLALLNLLPAEFSRLAVWVALDTFIILMAIIGGRVIPAFTRNAIAGANPQSVKTIELTAFGSLILILIAGIMEFWHPLQTSVWLVLLGTATLAHGIRWLLWKPYLTYRDPLLCMLPTAYAWIPIALALRALARMDFIPLPTAVHALTLGAMGGLMLAMMMRSALGHTGRPLTAGCVEIAAFLLVQLAAVVRVLSGLVPTQFQRETILVSGSLWSLAFLVFVLGYWPVLTRARIDGRPG